MKNIELNNQEENNLIKYKIANTSHDWIFNLGLIITIFGVLYTIISEWNSKTNIKFKVIIVDLTFIIATMFLLYFHLRYRWQKTIIIFYSILLITHIISTIHHAFKYYKNR